MSDSNGNGDAGVGKLAKASRLGTPAGVATLIILVIQGIIPLLSNIDEGIDRNCRATQDAVEVSGTLAKVDNELRHDPDLKHVVKRQIEQARNKC